MYLLEEYINVGSFCGEVCWNAFERDERVQDFNCHWRLRDALLLTVCPDHPRLSCGPTSCSPSLPSSDL